MPRSDPGAGTAPLVSVVVVNYNGATALERCLGALVGDQDDADAEILVVDNASSDGSASFAEGLAERDERVRLFRSPTNRGYAGAVNLAVTKARGTWVAVLNMDVVVAAGWLDPLISFLEATPDAGAVCPLIVLESDPGRINAAGQDIHVTGLGFNRLLEQPRERAGDDPFRVNGLHGAAFMIRRDLLERVGGWDESGFLYHEDVELSWLLRLAGKEIYCVPASTVRHDYHLTMFPQKLFLLERNRWSMLLADLGGATRLALAPLLGPNSLPMKSSFLPGAVAWYASSSRRCTSRPRRSSTAPTGACRSFRSTGTRTSSEVVLVLGTALRQQPGGLEVEQGRGDDQELGGLAQPLIAPDSFLLLDVRDELVGDLRQGDLGDVQQIGRAHV